MKKLTIKTFVLSGLIFVASCDPSDDGTGYQQLDRNFDPVNATIVMDSNLSVTEVADEDIMVPITINLDREAPFKTYYTVDYEGSTLVEGEEYSGPHTILVPEYTSSVTEYITITSDCDFEDTEFLQGTVAGSTTGNVNVTPLEFNISVDNYLSDDIDLTFSWAGVANVNAGGTNVEVDLCSIADIDLYIFDSTFQDTGIYDAATGDCPEHLVISPEWGDGLFYLVGSVWSFEDKYDGYDISGSDIPFDLTLSQSKCGSDMNSSHVIEGAINYNLGPGQDFIMGTVTISNGKITDVTFN